MTVHAHHHPAGPADASPVGGPDDGPVPAAEQAPSSEVRAGSRPRWLMPAVIGGLVVLALVVTGILPVSLVLYGGLFGGMALMHVGGHGGHGGHGSHDTRSSSVGEGKTDSTTGCH